VKKIPDESVVRLDGADAQSRQTFVMFSGYKAALERVMKVVLGLVKRARRDAQEPDEFFRIIATKTFGCVAGRGMSRLSDLTAVFDIP